MLMLPYSTELRLGSRPYVVYAVMLLCFIIFYFQQENRKEIDVVFGSFCETIYAPDKQTDNYDYMRSDKDSCSHYLKLLHYQSNPEHWVDYNVELFKDKYTREELEQYAVYELRHYHKLTLQDLPESLDTKLMYYPTTFNPFKMLTSALSHADWSHIIFNLIFFFAFAPALEILAGSKLKFIGVLVTIEVVGGVLYSIVSIITDTNIPTLGLSGSVMGMIGFSAFMMPWARIRTFIWFWSFARTFAIPAWLLASWYIGWDVYDLFSRTENGGVNVLAHVAGGFTGYAMGYLFFKKQKDIAQYELGVEIDYMRSKRESFSSIPTLYKGDGVYVDNKLREHDAKKEFGHYNEELYRYVKAGKTSEALALLIEKYDLFEESPEIYIELFNDIGEWKKKRVYLGAGRLVIDLLVEKKQYGKIPKVLSLCLEAEPDFVIADPVDLIFIVNYLKSVNQFEMAYQLVTDAVNKYGENIDACDCVLAEANILWANLEKETEAKALLEKAMATASEMDKKKLSELLGVVS